MAAIEVVPDEVRYWLATSSSISRGVQEIASAAQGKVTVPGELRTITKEEVSLFPVVVHSLALLMKLTHRFDSLREQAQNRNSDVFHSRCNLLASTKQVKYIHIRLVPPPLGRHFGPDMSVVYKKV